MSRAHAPFFTNSHAIRQEIQRFESVHPSIYAIYDLIELVQDPSLAQQVREHVVCIEDSFVNSQEWTLGRGVPDLRLGIVGSLSSGKSALVHRYLTGSYMHEESPEGGRFKKEVSVDGHSFLLLIRDEGGPPELQFSTWVDAVVFVFSLENESSFNAIYHYYSKMNFFRNTADVPIILVGTQDSISDTSPRVIDDVRARKLAGELKKCTYFETCATYGLNVDAVFQVACQKVLQQRHVMSPRCSPAAAASSNSQYLTRYQSAGAYLGSPAPPPPPPVSLPPINGTITPCSAAQLLDSPPSTQRLSLLPSQQQQQQQQQQEVGLRQFHSVTALSSSEVLCMQPPAQPPPLIVHSTTSVPTANNNNNNNNSDERVCRTPHVPVITPATTTTTATTAATPHPGSTPTSARKSRRRSNLFAAARKTASLASASASNSTTTTSSATDDIGRGAELGSGRAIPVKQGYLYKRSQKTLNKEWKKKYVTISDDGRLVYHSSLHEYMDAAPGKQVFLQYTTVKVPGHKPRGSKSLSASTNNNNNNNNQLNEAISSLSIASGGSLPGHGRSGKETVMLTAYEMLCEPSTTSSSTTSTTASNGITSSSAPLATPDDSQVPTSHSSTPQVIDTPSVKKRHRRGKGGGGSSGGGGAGGGGGCDDHEQDTFEFCVVSLDNKQWQFEAGSQEERDEWVTAIEQQILSSLQNNASAKSAGRSCTSIDPAILQTIRTAVSGNSHCVDCGAAKPEWASLNLGVLMCIECSGVHRQLGSHISRVRSLELDEWPAAHVAVMMALGNTAANQIWEACTHGWSKPSSNCSRDEKQRWIIAKYERRQFIQPCPSNNNHNNNNSSGDSAAVLQCLVEAVCRADARAVALALIHVTSSSSRGVNLVNVPVSPRDSRTVLHLASALASLPVVQMLIWCGADVSRVDAEGRSAVMFAQSAGTAGQAVVDLLINCGANSVGGGGGGGVNTTSNSGGCVSAPPSRRRISMIKQTMQTALMHDSTANVL